MTATLFMLCGLPGSGKTTVAKKLEAEHRALRLSPDEWIEALLGKETPDRERLDALRGPVEKLQWETAQRVLTIGTSVILENGFWSRQERQEYRRQAEALAVHVRLVFLDASREELWDRLKRRNLTLPIRSAFRVTEADLDTWSKWFERPAAEELAAPQG